MIWTLIVPVLLALIPIKPSVRFVMTKAALILIIESNVSAVFAAITLLYSFSSVPAATTISEVTQSLPAIKLLISKYVAKSELNKYCTKDASAPQDLKQLATSKVRAVVRTLKLFVSTTIPASNNVASKRSKRFVLLLWYWISSETSSEEISCISNSGCLWISSRHRSTSGMISFSLITM